MTADLALAADPGFLERSADPAEFVIQACERAKVWLREVLDHGDIDQIVEVKSQAEAMRIQTITSAGVISRPFAVVAAHWTPPGPGRLSGESGS